MPKKEERIPASQKLVEALQEVHAPAVMIERAKANYYDEYKGDQAFPIMRLVEDARAAGLQGIAQRAMDGEFDAAKWESDAWMRSPEGQETMGSLARSLRPRYRNEDVRTRLLLHAWRRPKNG